MKRGQELQCAAVLKSETALRVDAHNNAVKDGKYHPVDEASQIVCKLHHFRNQTSNCGLHVPFVIWVRGEVHKFCRRHYFWDSSWTGISLKQKI